MKPQIGLTKVQILIMAATAGICVANVYYSQPILKTIALDLKIPEKSIGSILVMAQIGYGLGLFFLTPIGDKTDRKKLILWQQTLLMGALLMIGFSSSLPLLLFASFLVGMFSTVAQVILPMAASIVTRDKGKTVGLIFTGILAGVLCARTFSGLISDWLGWRYVYFLSAGLVLCSAILMQADFPNAKDRFNGNYIKLLSSSLYQFKRFSLLRSSAVIGALVFGVMSSFWTTVTFHLSMAPYFYKPAQIGLYGLLAAGSALLVPLFGKLADGGHANRSLLFTIGMIVLSILVQFFLPGSVIALCITIFLLDIGVQATQATNLAVIYSLDNAANSRINTIYMTCYFIGGAGGAFTGLYCWNHWQWTGVIAQLATLTALAIVLVFIRMASQKSEHSGQVKTLELVNE